MLEKIQEQKAEKKNEIIESVLRELSDTGAYEKEVNGCTEFLRGINYSINTIYKAEKRNERVDEITGKLMVNTKDILDNADKVCLCILIEDMRITTGHKYSHIEIKTKQPFEHIRFYLDDESGHYDMKYGVYPELFKLA